MQEIHQYAEKCRHELESLEFNEDILKDLQGKLTEELHRAQKLALSLSAQRRVAARTLEESIKKEFTYLRMNKAKFKVDILYRLNEEGSVVIDEKKYDLNPYGLDKVEFLISTNEKWTVP